MRRLSLSFAALALLVLAGCKSPCRQLSEQLCGCEPTSIERESCIRRTANEESRVQPTEADQQVCAQLLAAEPGCTCQALDTLEGKRACGLAR